ncbi:MAG: SDR family oxidoreductase [Deltaproteobacteria bacterium]|nr:SDR family oxidoreductase [Deltaproteobacteria bacterium]
MNLSSKNEHIVSKPVALVTGGVRRLGRCISEHLQRDFRVVAHFCDSSAHAEELARTHPDILPMQADLTLPGAPARLIDSVIDVFGELHLLVNNAGLFVNDTTELVQLAKMKTLNVDAPEKLIGAARSHLSRNHGQIINISDIAGIRPFKLYKAYSRSKSAILQFCANHALELAKENIRINTICPGLVLPSENEQSEKTLAHLQSQIPLQRMGKAQDVAELVAFLAHSNFITGQVICVDGGRLLNSEAKQSNMSI